MRYTGVVARVGLILAVVIMAAALATPAVAGCTVGATLDASGEVVNCCGGQGLIVRTDTGLLKLVGLGPVWFWQAAKYDRPEIGDKVHVWWNPLVCNNVEQNVLVALDYLEDLNPLPLSLRDADNQPLWKAAQRQILRQQRLAHQHRNGQAE